MILRRASGQGWPGLILVGLVLALSGCTSTNRKAPVEERITSPRSAAPAASAPTVQRSPVVAAAPAASAAAPVASAADTAASAPPPPPGAENAGKPGYYTVKPGENLRRIAADNGQNWRDVARWNNLQNPDVVEVGQVLRIVPPPGEARVARATPPTPAASTPGTVETRPPEPMPSPPPPPPPPANAEPVGDEVAWIWPASGPVIAGFDEGRNKGLTIAGQAGDPVVAAGDGRVVYAGSSLRGYGNLVIVKHNEVYLTAYAHNQALLVKDDQVVRRGQKIAEMGSTDAQRVQLHFEIRRQGKPVDPAKLLPPR